MKTALAIATLTASVLVGTSSAQEPRIYEAGRYVRVVAVPDQAQARPLETVVSLAFPRRDISTVGDAARYLLRRTGYTIPDVDAGAFPEHAKVTGFALPEVHREFDGVTISSILDALAGAAYRPVINDEERTVVFELKENSVQGKKRRKHRI